MHYFNAVTLSPRLLGLKETVLRQKAVPLDFEQWSTPQLEELVSEMFWLQHHLEGVGLAAPQIGFSLQLAVIDNHQDPPCVLINPEIIERSQETESDSEGCLSLPGYRGPVARAKRVHVKTQDVKGQTVEFEAEGFFARVIQHEVDHLHGMLYADRLESFAELEPVDADTLAQRAMKQVWGGNGPGDG